MLLAIALASVGCNKAEPTPTTVAVGSGSAIARPGPIAAAGPCFATDVEGVLKAFTADDKTATFCVNQIDISGGATAPVVKCMAVDLASGVYRVVPPPAVVPEATTYKQDDRAVEACTGGNCVALELPLPPREQPYAIHASADGKHLLATGQPLKGIAVLDGTTGKKQRLIPLGDGDSECLEDAYYVGSVIYAITSVCAGPGGTGYLFDGKGTRIAKMDTDRVNVYGSAPVQLAGDQWAFADFGGGTFMIWDVKAGKEIRTVKVARLEDCDSCALLGGESMQATPLVKTPSGKLVTITATGVTVADPETGKVGKTAKMPMCPKASPAQ